MHPSFRTSRARGFTFVELLLALALGVLVVATLGLLLRSLFVSGEMQAERLDGPFAARRALRTLSREISCAFAPPADNLVPLELSSSSEPGKPEILVSFYLPVSSSDFPGAYDVHRVQYQVVSTESGKRELLRISAPCSGPATNAPSTNLLFRGRFSLSAQAGADGKSHPRWPPADEPAADLPDSLSLSLRLHGRDVPMQTEALVHSASVVRSPVQRPPVEPPPADPAAQP